MTIQDESPTLESTVVVPESQADLIQQDSETLHTDDVIELQAFLERRSWIQDKIQLIERMPAIEVFVGIDSLRESSDPIPGLPSREELDAWVKNLDQIDSETEKFDKGDMNRLKDFAKTKSKQNLSPADTDLIEVTLTTLLALDTLIHLLRARSDALDLLDLRLVWEEQRLSVWNTRASLLEQVRSFIRRASWSPALYQEPDQEAATPSSSSIAATPELLYPEVLSQTARSRRYKLSEEFLREAKRLTSQLIAYHKDVLPRPGATLDRILDTSFEKVPEAIFDEQDKLENDSKALENLDKFTMSLMTQWKKSDEFYGELKKDQATAQLLLEDIDKARGEHPSPRLDESFASRCTSLSTRLSAIGHPSTIIPRPRHPLHPEQTTANESVHLALSTELAVTIKASRKVQLKSKEYHAIIQAVQRVTSLRSEATTLRDRLESMTSRLAQGIDAGDGDGTIPNLDDEGCLQPTRHGAYIALLPSFLEDVDATDTSARLVALECRTALLELRRATVEPSFREDTVATIEALEEARTNVAEGKANALRLVQLLKQARAIFNGASEGTTAILGVKEEVTDAVEQDKWKARRGRDGAPLTPDSPEPTRAIMLITLEATNNKISTLTIRLTEQVQDPLLAVAPSLPLALASYLQQRSDEAWTQITSVKALVEVWQRIQSQTKVMREVSDEGFGLEGMVDDLRAEIGQATETTLKLSPWVPGSGQGESFGAALEDLCLQVKRFSDSLSTRIPFVSSNSDPHLTSSTLPTSKSSPSLGTTGRHMSAEAIHRMLLALDHAVRTDVNVMTMSLDSGVAVLGRKLDQFRLAELARTLDNQLETDQRDSHAATLLLLEQSQVYNELLAQQSQDIGNELAKLSVAVQSLADEQSPKLQQSLDETSYTLKQMQSSPGARDAGVHDDIILSRSRAFEDAQRRVQTFRQDIGALQARVFESQRQADDDERQRHLLEERNEMKRRTSQDRAQLEASQRALQESEEKNRLAIEQQQKWQAEHDARMKEEAEFFATAGAGPSRIRPVSALHGRIMILRNELRSIGINDAARPMTDPETSMELVLPSGDDARSMGEQLEAVVTAFSSLPSVPPEDVTTQAELKSLKFEIDASRPLLRRVEQLAEFSTATATCDSALSDLLEHLDTFPALPTDLASPHVSNPALSPVRQLKARMEYCKTLMSNIKDGYGHIIDDERVKVEKTRLEQTWAELSDMGNEKVGSVSRPPTIAPRLSSVRSGAFTPDKNRLATPVRPERSRLRTSSQVGSPSTPRQPSTRRDTAPSRASSGMTARSVSGPSTSTPTSSSLHKSTYSSRQRTNSNASSTVTSTPIPIPRARTGSITGSSRRPASPAFSDKSTFSSFSRATPRTSARTPRLSLSGNARPPLKPIPSTPPSKQTVRKSYVANPKNKLDMAVGEVMNKLPTNVNIEVVPVTWQDQSGKYWIGDTDPKLCFCRILRSQTVMVRVGGGWVELSKFIRNHFAHLFKIGTSPPRTNPSEEKWISSASLLGPSQSPGTPSLIPHLNPLYRPSTPPPRIQFSPSLSPSASFSSRLNGLSPPLITDATSPGSPLTPLQFLRRASVEPGARSSSPTPHRGASVDRMPSQLGKLPITAPKIVWRP